MERRVLDRGESGLQLIEWSGDYHGVGVRVRLVQISPRWFEWTVFARGVEVLDPWGIERRSRREDTAIRAALERVAVACGIDPTTSPSWLAVRARRAARRREERSRQRLVERAEWLATQPALPGLTR